MARIICQFPPGFTTPCASFFLQVPPAAARGGKGIGDYLPPRQGPPNPVMGCCPCTLLSKTCTSCLTNIHNAFLVCLCFVQYYCKGNSRWHKKVNLCFV